MRHEELLDDDDHLENTSRISPTAKGTANKHTLWLFKEIFLEIPTRKEQKTTNPILNEATIAPIDSPVEITSSDLSEEEQFFQEIPDSQSEPLLAKENPFSNSSSTENELKLFEDF